MAAVLPTALMFYTLGVSVNIAMETFDLSIATTWQQPI